MNISKPTTINLNDFQNQIEEVRKSFETLSKSKENSAQLKTEFLGKKGKIKSLGNLLALLPNSDKKSAGQLLNQLKQAVQANLDSQPIKTDSSIPWFDLTLPGTKPKIGHLHPVTQAIEEISQIFESIGFTRVRYKEVDWDYYVFEALNMPPNHPARDEWETFFVDSQEHPSLGKMVLTTHTSNGQVHEMERVKKPPIRMLNIGKTYRRQQDVTHVAMFHQFEGLVIDKGINITHLKGTLDYFARKFYGPSAKSRIRPFMFKFTEPSFEVDFSCTHCQGKGCKYCKSGWHEVGGAGMVHPNVLKAGGIDPDLYTGFAFGWGIERVYSLKPGLSLNDVRDVYSTKLEFLQQF